MRLSLLAVLALCFGAAVRACGPGRGAGRRRGSHKVTPLVFSQHDPNVSENSLAGSGLPEGRVSRDDEKFKDLVPNYNPDIIFKDEEGTGADRVMTQRCKEKLNTLAISVMNKWPGVRLRVLDGWDEEGRRSVGSLHYEGRAVDVTTSDRDRGKYGMLARLAVDAGFDWVYYESRSHIHCSVKSESSSAARGAGCFPAESVVFTPSGPKPIGVLRIGEMVLAADRHGRMHYSDVIMFLDRDPNATRQFIQLKAEGNYSLTVTPAHLVMRIQGDGDLSQAVPAFAAILKEGDRLIVANPDGTSRTASILSSSLVLRRGVFAPLTRAGTVVVDRVLASCYAAVDSQRLAHAAFAPARLLSGAVSIWSAAFDASAPRPAPVPVAGVHWYADLLYRVASRVLPRTLMYER